GGFRYEAAAMVAGATLSQLNALVEKLLLRVTENRRYSIHELLRQYALDRLQETPYAGESIRTQYSAYYLKYLVDWLQPEVSWRQQTLVAELEEEIDNITSAWQWTLQQNDLDAIERSCPSYGYFLWM